MIYENIENTILSRLHPLVDLGVEVIKLPENKNSPQHLPRVTIAYLKSNFGEKFEPRIVGPNTCYDETVFVEMVVESTKLRGTTGVYNIIEIVKQQLVGFSPGDCGKLLIDKIRNAENTNPITWSFNVIMYCNRLQVEKDPEETYPLLTQVNFENEHTNETFHVQH